MFEMKFDIMSITDTIEYILEEGCSISRFGDGELALMNHFSIPFQKYDRKLSKELKAVYLSRRDDLLICVPEPLNTLNPFTEKERNWWKKDLNVFRRWFWCKGIRDWSYKFGNAFITRPYMPYENKSQAAMIFSSLKRLWDNSDVCLVEGKKSRLGVGNDLFDNANSLSRILGPAENAYSKIDEIEDFIIRTIPTDNLILLALGPTATVLSSRLSLRGYHALDIGHVDIEYEWFLMNAREKTVVKDKYTNEVDGGQSVDSIFCDDLYEKHIIRDFSF